MKILEEKLDKERLKAIFLKDPNAVVKYTIKAFLEKGLEPPEEFIEAISQGAYASKKYLETIIHWTDKEVPKVITQGALKNPDIAFEIFKDPELKPYFSDEDLEEAIAKNSSYALQLHLMYKEKNKKTPLVIWKSITQSSTASLYLARDFINDKKPIPNEVLKGIITNVEKLLTFSVELLKSNFDLPDIILNALSQHADAVRSMVRFDDVLFEYAEQGKEIPQILIDAVSKRNWGDKNLYRLCIDLASKGIKIPDSVLNIFIDKTPKDGPNWIGDQAYNILMYYLKIAEKISYNREKRLRNLPTKLYPYLMIPFGSYMRSMVEGFLKAFGKVPEDFKQEILKHYDEYSKREYIPKDIAQAIGINESTIIKEKLDKEKLFDRFKRNHFERDKVIKTLVKNNKEIPEYLMKMIEKSVADASTYAFLLMKQEKEVPENILKTISKYASYSLSHAKEYITKGEKIPDILLKGISTDSFMSYDFGVTLLGVKKEIAPEIILNSIAQFPHISRFYTQSLLHHKVKVPEIIKKGLSKSDFESLKEIEKKTITESLNKEKLIYSVSKENAVAIDLIQQLAYADKDIPDLLSLVVAEKNAANICAKIAAHIIAYSDKKVPEALLEKISTNKKIANDIAYIYKNNRKEVPDIIRNVLNKKEKEFLDNWFYYEQTTINESLDKDRLLDVIGKDEGAYDQILKHYFYDKDELPPEKFIDMASKNVIAAVMFAEYCLEKKKEIRPDIIEKVAEHPRSAYTIAALLDIEGRDVPEILVNSIKEDPLVLKQYQNFLSKRNIPETKVYAKI